MQSSKHLPRNLSFDGKNFLVLSNQMHHPKMKLHVRLIPPFVRFERVQRDKEPEGEEAVQVQGQEVRRREWLHRPRVETGGVPLEDAGLSGGGLLLRVELGGVVSVQGEGRPQVPKEDGNSYKGRVLNNMYVPCRAIWQMSLGPVSALRIIC